jgi:hypothetical protein
MKSLSLPLPAKRGEGRGEGLLGAARSSPHVFLSPASTGFPAFSHPLMPSGITAASLYPSLTASRAAAWLACHLGPAQ